MNICIKKWIALLLAVILLASAAACEDSFTASSIACKFGNVLALAKLSKALVKASVAEVNLSLDFSSFLSRSCLLEAPIAPIAPAPTIPAIPSAAPPLDFIRLGIIELSIPAVMLA